MPHFSLAAVTLWTVAGIFPITNALLTTWLVMAMLFIFAIVATSRLSLVPSSLQSITELIIGGLYDFFYGVIGDHIKTVFGLIASLFLFILIANWVGLLPGVGTIGFFHVRSPIYFFVGLLELISDISKVVSFAFRLFGNIFAGEVLLTVMAFLMPFIVPLPFLMLELFVGFIQALVFSMLTAVFLNLA